jgi:16S rRNA (cytidine1402-2'-O)-methyltransferase
MTTGTENYSKFCAAHFDWAKFSLRRLILSVCQVSLVSTPIGNLGDLSTRAKKSLIESDLIIAEDTRSTKSLLQLIEVDYSEKKFLTFHEHNQDNIDFLIHTIESFRNVIIVSDAGSPLLSDPGFPLVEKCREKGINVTSIPGPSAVVCALEVSGLAPVPFMFMGFLPRKKEARQNLFSKSIPGITYIGFESPNRVISLVEDLLEIEGDFDIVLARELTKKFEETYRFNRDSWPGIKDRIKAKGEFVVLFRLTSEKPIEDVGNKKLESLANAYLEKPTPKALARLLAPIKGLSVKECYELLK